MKAIVQDRYGPPETLRLADVDTPVPAPDEVLVRVEAAALNAYDWHAMRGEPLMARLAMGRSRPRARIRGRDFAGRVEAVGANVRQFSPGDAVFGDLGDANGAFAEYVCVPANVVAPVPANLTPQQAAALPLAGVTALMGLSDVGRVEPGHRVLVNGASGGVGTLAVQLAKALGATVTGCAAPATSTWSAASAPTTSSTTPATTSQGTVAGTTSCSTWSATVHSVLCGGR